MYKCSCGTTSEKSKMKICTECVDRCCDKCIVVELDGINCCASCLDYERHIKCLVCDSSVEMIDDDEWPITEDTTAFCDNCYVEMSLTWA